MTTPTLDEYLGLQQRIEPFEVEQLLAELANKSVPVCSEFLSASIAPLKSGPSHPLLNQAIDAVKRGQVSWLSSQPNPKI